MCTIILLEKVWFERVDKMKMEVFGTSLTKFQVSLRRFGREINKHIT